jgi:hypothetical protein
MLGFDSYGSTTVQMAQGPDYAQNRLKICVKVVDNNGGSSSYCINTPIVVTKNSALFNSVVNDILSKSPSSTTLQSLYGGSTQVVLSIMQSIASVQTSVSQSLANSKNCTLVFSFLIILDLFLI